MPNHNCLEGIRCPNCGHEDRFNIEVRCFAEFTDDDCETYGDNEWDEKSSIQCYECDHQGIIEEFCIEAKETQEPKKG